MATPSVSARVFARRQVRALGVGRLCDAHGIVAPSLKRVLWEWLPTRAQDEALEEFLAGLAVGKGLRYVPPEVRNLFRFNREAVLAAVTRSGWDLAVAAPGLQADREVALAAVAQNGYALQYVAAALRGDREEFRAPPRALPFCEF